LPVVVSYHWYALRAPKGVLQLGVLDASNWPIPTMRKGFEPTTLQGSPSVDFVGVFASKITVYVVLLLSLHCNPDPTDLMGAQYTFCKWHPRWWHNFKRKSVNIYFYGPPAYALRDGVCLFFFLVDPKWHFGQQILGEKGEWVN